MLQSGYNRLGVILVSEKEYVKALVDKLNERQLRAFKAVLEAIIWPEEELAPDEIAELEEARAEIRSGRGIKAADVWEELGI